MPSDSMNIGVSGLDAYQAQIDVISNNIANVGTTGFKGQILSFQDLLYQTQQPGSAPSKTNGGVNYQQLGIGVKIGGTDTNTQQGGVQTTGVNTNMMVNGDGYFILRNIDGTGTPSYTRNGDFTLSSSGLLFDATSGQGVMGYSADSAGNIVSGTPGPIQIPIGLKTQATATGTGVKTGPAGDKVFSMAWGGNVDSTKYALAVADAAAAATAGVPYVTPPSSLATAGTTIYDSLGGPHLVQITMQPVLMVPTPSAATPVVVLNAAGVAVTAATEWSYTLTASDGTLFDNTAALPAVANSSVSAPQYVYFDQDGHFINTSPNATDGAGPNVGIGHSATALPTAAAGDAIKVQQWGVSAGADNSRSSSAPPSTPIGIDFSGMSSNAASAQVVASYQDGFAPGTLDNMSVGTDGTITGAFTNGQSVALAQVALAAFQNEAGLLRAGSSRLLESVDSGGPLIGQAASGRLGSITGNALELSNVSIADEFTKLITAQNAFTANSKSITTANTDDQTVINLIR